MCGSHVEVPMQLNYTWQEQRRAQEESVEGMNNGPPGSRKALFYVVTDEELCGCRG